MNVCIGVDIGTSSVKGVLVDERGTVLASAGETIDLHRPQQGIAEQDPYEVLNACHDVVRRLLDASAVHPKDIAAISFDGQMGGAMAVDADLEPLTPWHPSSLDLRYLEAQQRILDLFGEAPVIERSGSQPILGAWALRWAEDAELRGRMRKVLLLANWVAARVAALPVEEAFIDPSYLTWTGVADTRARRWDDAMVQELGLSDDVLPNIVRGSTIVGGVGTGSAAATGLRVGTPVVAGVGDQVAGFVGAGAIAAGQLVDAAGTFPVFAVCLDRYLPDSRVRMLKPLAGPGSDTHWYNMMYISGGGLTYDWAVRRLAAGIDHAELERRAAAVPPGCGGLLAVPHFLGRACPDEVDVRGAFVGLSWNHDTEHLFRALLESFAYDYRVALTVIRDQWPDAVFEQVAVTGGGSRSHLWNNIKADVLGIPFAPLEGDVATPLGSAIVAATGVGIHNDLAAAVAAMVPLRHPGKVDGANHALYAHYAEAYERLLNALKPIYRELATLGAVDSKPGPSGR